MKQHIKLNSSQHKIYFEDKNCNSISICKALCCRNWDINLAHEEYIAGVYKAEVFCSKDKSVCVKEQMSCPYSAYRLKKNKDGSCIYLNKDNKCKIHSTRPIVCRNFFCDNGFNLEPVCLPNSDELDDVEICSFEGGLSLKTKFLLVPYLKLKKMSKEKNSFLLIFRDITSCHEKKVNLLGFDYFSSKKEIEFLLNQFDGKNSLGVISKKVSKFLSKRDLLNLVFYFGDEEVLIGLFG